jgi:hypothetical protein
MCYFLKNKTKVSDEPSVSIFRLVDFDLVVSFDPEEGDSLFFRNFCLYT